MSAESVDISLKNIDRTVNAYIQTIDNRGVAVEKDISLSCEHLKSIADARLSDIEMTLTGYINAVYNRLIYYSLDMFMHFSPSLAAIISAIWTVISNILYVIGMVLDFLKAIHIKEIHDILYTLWPVYKEMIDKIYTQVGKLSKAIGWGADGIAHVMMAVQGVKGIAGSIMGKDEMWLQMAWAEKAIDVSKDVAYYTAWAERDAGDFLNWVFQMENYKSNNEIKGWAGETLGFIGEAAERSKKALEEAAGVFSELSAIQNNMPEIIAKHIPQKIWDTLADAEGKIYDKILPAIAQLDALRVRAERITGILGGQISAIAARLANPGNLLLTVDDMPAYARESNLSAIDDVTSRKLAAQAEAERAALSADLDEFDRIDAALTAETPQPVFLDLEAEGRGAAPGIVVEPLETWMINGYSDSL